MELKKLKEEYLFIMLLIDLIRILKVVSSESMSISCENIYINSDYAVDLNNCFSYYSYFSRFNDESVLNVCNIIYFFTNYYELDITVFI